MSKFKVKGSGFTLIPEGRRVFKITEVDDSKYEKFGEVIIRFQDKAGNSHSERYLTIKKDGEVNDGAIRALSFMIQTALNNFELDGYEVELSDIVGHYIEGEIKHEEYVKTDGTNGKSARLGDIKPATSFENKTLKASTTKKPKVTKVEEEEEVEDIDDIDDFLND